MEEDLRESSDGFGDTRSQDSLSFDRNGNIVLHTNNPQVAKPPRTLQLPLGQFVQNALARNDSVAFPGPILSPDSLAALSRHIEEYVMRCERLRVSLRQGVIAAALAFTPGCVRIVA